MTIVEKLEKIKNDEGHFTISYIYDDGFHGVYGLEQYGGGRFNDDTLEGIVSKIYNAHEEKLESFKKG